MPPLTVARRANLLSAIAGTISIVAGLWPPLAPARMPASLISIVAFLVACSAWIARRHWTGPLQLPDPDTCDLDISGLNIRFVARIGREFLINCNGGTGRWRNTSTHEMQSVQALENMDIALGYHDHLPTDPTLTHPTHVERTLIAWQNNGTPFRLIAAPGHPFLLIGQDAQHLRLPRADADH